MLYKAFYPYTNGEKSIILRSFAIGEFFDKNNKLKLDKLIDGYKQYVKRLSFNAFREKDESGNYKWQGLKNKTKLLMVLKLLITTFTTMTKNGN